MKKIVSMLLVLAMLVGVVPATALASETTESTGAGMHLDKTATLENDGTYTIKLEAYAEGQVDKINKPADIVLVLDQSASMYTPMGANAKYLSCENAYHNEDTLITSLNTDLGAKTGYYIAQNKEPTTVNGKQYWYWYVLRYENNEWEKYQIYYTSKPIECGSSGWTFDENIKKTTSTESTLLQDCYIYKTQYGALYDAISDFSVKLGGTGVDHRISVVGFSSDYAKDKVNGYAAGSGIYNNGTFSLYSELNGTKEFYSSLEKVDTSETLTATDVYKNAFASVKTNLTSVKASMEAVKTDYVNTHHEIGLRLAKNILANNREGSLEDKVGRERFVVFFTDGTPSGSAASSLDEEDIALRAIDEAYKIKNEENTTVYSIYTAAAAADFLAYVSSDYPTITVDAVRDVTLLDSTNLQGLKYTKPVRNAEDMNAIFTSIFQEVSNSSAELNGSAVLKDIISDEFTLPTGFEAQDVLVQTSNYLGRNDWAEAVTVNDSTDQTNYDSNINVTVTNNNTVNVSGFDYAGNYVANAIESTNKPARGKKLIVTVKGVLPKEGAATNAEVYTNNAFSGIYAEADASAPTVPFAQPTTVLPRKSYVLDYAKAVKVPATDWEMSQLADINDVKENDIISINSNKRTGYVDSKYGSTYMIKELDGWYLNYMPQTMNWDGYDTICVWGETTNAEIKAATANTNGHVWACVDFIPATSVYYEDSFVTDAGDGIIGLTYSDGWSVENYSSDTFDAQQSSANTVYGTDDAYADDLGFSDGSAHKVTIAEDATTSPKVSFTFTGTGLDIYTSTTDASGQVLVRAVGKTTGKGYAAWIDNEFKASDDSSLTNKTLYQVPTVSIQDMVRDTYDVTITVTSDVDGNSTYYLDAIRVYNPLNENADDIVEKAYAEAKENNALTAEVRDFIIDPANADIATDAEEIAGAVYIDKINSSKDVVLGSENIATYKDLGPKNEVYLAPDKSIAFEIATPYQGKALLGVKAPNGTASKVSVNGVVMEINTATDMYYEITPATTKTDAEGKELPSTGMVVIKNTGNALISITKLRLTQVGAAVQTLSLRSTRALMEYAASLDEVEETPVVNNPFTDVADDSYYYDAVMWAVENGVTNGVSATKFGVGQSCTRAQVVTFLWRAAGCPEPETTACSFTDVKAGSYYYKPVLWAVENGITSGTSQTSFSPDTSVTRGQFVTFLHRAEGKPESMIENPYKDVVEDSFYYDAVLWATENGLTNGTSATEFRPDAECTREQIVTFLWRASEK